MSDPDAYSPAPNDAKCEELLLYICERQITNRSFSLAKLNLLLCLSDMLNFRRYQSSITGGQYVRGEYAPWKVDLAETVAMMEEDGRLTIVDQPIGGFLQRRPLALDSANLFGFNGAEIAACEQVLRAADGQSADNLAELSDEMLSWSNLALGDTIPYEAALE